MFTQMFWLEGSFKDTCRQGCMQGLEKITITFRRGDWWYNETNEPLGINPYRGNADVGMMKHDMKHGASHMVDESWATGFGEIQGLKEVGIEFETSDDKKEELEQIVEWAKSWRFPMGEGKVLVTERQKGVGQGDVQTMEWRGSSLHWSEICPYCQPVGGETCSGKPENEKCAQRNMLMRLGQGPLLIIFKLKWKLRRVDEL